MTEWATEFAKPGNHPLLVESRGAPFIEPVGDPVLGQVQVSIVLEYCSGGDLALLLEQQHPLGEARVLKLLTAHT